MKYIFQQGGPSDNNYDSTDFFNQYVDHLMQSQQQQQEQESPQEDQSPDEETDYIKNLRAQENDQTDKSFELLQQLSGKIANIEKELHYHQQSLEEQQNNINWFSSSEGIDYTRSKYDTKNPQSASIPVYNKPSIPLNILRQNQMMAESGGDNYAVSPKGAVGAYQFMPGTWEQYKPYPSAVPTDPKAAGQAYTKYMNDLTNEFGDQRKAVAAYNYGPGNLQKLIDKHGNEWESYLPTETKNYLNKVIPTSGIHTKDNSVDLQGVNNNLLNIVSSFPGLVVTSGTDGTHVHNSAHYDGDAIDIGANSSNKQAYNKFKQFLPQLQQKYGIKYLDEGNHIHLSLSNKGKL